MSQEQRIKGLLATLAKLAAERLETRAPADDGDDSLSALSDGINLLAEELQKTFTLQKAKVLGVEQHRRLLETIAREVDFDRVIHEVVRFLGESFEGATIAVFRTDHAARILHLVTATAATSELRSVLNGLSEKVMLESLEASASPGKDFLRERFERVPSGAGTGRRWRMRSNFDPAGWRRFNRSARRSGARSASSSKMSDPSNWARWKSWRWRRPRPRWR